LNAIPFYRDFILSSRPLLLIGGILAYALGAGIASYLGNDINWTSYWLGQACLTLLQVSSYYLRHHFDLIENPVISSSDEDPQLRVRRRQLFLQLAVTTLSVGAVLTVLLFTNRFLNPSSLVILGLAFILSILYAVPPVRLVYSGYGELVTAFLLANLAPALSFLFQTGQIHRMLGLITFPLTFLSLATSIVISLPVYASDIKYNRRTMLVRFGWQRGMIIHNYLIAAAYFLVVASGLVGLPWGLTWPALLTIPLALFQVWQVNQIAAGAKPRWRLLTYNGIATLGLTFYFLCLALWTN
jgi:1,4-dihydroxy-2-naphthoate octaprenyltransferase